MAVADDPSCSFSDCLCGWSKLCSPRVPRVAPGRDYAFIPAAAAADDDDDRAAWSFLVGITATSSSGGDRSLRLHRFRVAHSGRVLVPSSGGALEILGDDYYKASTPTSHIRAAAATPGGRSLSLCFFSREIDFSDPNASKISPPVPLRLHMDLAAGAADDGRRITVSRLPALPPETGLLKPTCPISAAGELWAPYLTEAHGPSRLVMQRLDENAGGGRWVKVAALDLTRPKLGSDMMEDYIPTLHGFAVVGGDTILLSLWPFHCFYALDCAAQAWSQVVTTKKDPTASYVPIHERGVYVEEDDTIYFLNYGTVYAYKLCKDDQGRYRMAPPIRVDTVCPFVDGGYGFLSHLGGRIMCAVWIGVKLPCSCDTKHVLITTFRVKGDDHEHEHFLPKGVHVLHSTCRRLDTPPSKPRESYLEFSFLQEYKEFDHQGTTLTAKRKRGDAMVPSALLEDMEGPASSNAVGSAKMLTCCRDFFNTTSFLCTVKLERSAVRTNIALFLICQVASHSTVYKINILDGRLMCHDKTVTPHCILETSMCDAEDGIQNRLHRPWHFVCDSKSIYAASSVENKVYSCCLDQGNINHIDSTRHVGVKFHLVVLVGIKVVAISGTLQDVYHLSQGKWTRHKTSGPPDLDKEVCLSGYVVLSSSTFMVSDAEENRCFLHDIVHDKWSIVEPFLKPEFLPSGWPVRAWLSERCVFAKGFIYTCSHWGLAAFELVEQGGSYYLGELVYLQFSWRNWERSRMCLEYVGEDTSSGAIMFCVAKDDQICQPGYPNNEKPVRITTVQVTTEGMADGKLRPKTIGHVHIGTTFVQCSGGAIWTRDCFAVAAANI